MDALLTGHEGWADQARGATDAECTALQQHPLHRASKRAKMLAQQGREQQQQHQKAGKHLSSEAFKGSVHRCITLIAIMLHLLRCQTLYTRHSCDPFLTGVHRTMKGLYLKSGHTAQGACPVRDSLRYKHTPKEWPHSTRCLPSKGLL